MNTRKMLASIVVFVAATAGWTTQAHASSEGCVAAGTSCAYRATKTGGIVAIGNWWRVTVVHGGRWTTYRPLNRTDAGHYVFRRVNAIRRGDAVYVNGHTPFDVWLPTAAGIVAVGPDYNR